MTGPHSSRRPSFAAITARLRRLPSALFPAARRHPARALVILVASTVVYAQCLSPPPWDDPDPIPSPSSATRALAIGPQVWGAPGIDLGATGATLALPPIDAPVAWSLAIDPSAHALLADERSVYVVLTETREVKAFDAATGDERWTVQTEGPPDRSPALAGDLLYVQVRGSGMLALHTDTGERAWSDASNRPLTATPNVAAGVVWAGKRGEVVALDAETGEQLARRGIGGQFVKARIAIGPEYLVIAKFDSLQLLRRSTGERTFEARFPDIGHVMIRDDLVIAASDRQIVAFDANSGLPWWDGIRDWWFRIEVYGGVPSLPAPANRWVQRTRCEVMGTVLAADRAIVACRDGTVRAHDLADGTVLWERAYEELATGPILTPAGLLLVGKHAFVMVEPLTGEELARRTVEGFEITSIAATSDALYVLTAEGQLLALREDGVAPDR